MTCCPRRVERRFNPPDARRALYVVVLVLLLAGKAVGQEPASESLIRSATTAPSTRPSTRPAWAADEILTVPLYVHVLRSEELPEANCSLTDDDVRRVVGKVNGIWSLGGIRFELMAIDRPAPANPERFRAERAHEAVPSLRPWRHLSPEASGLPKGMHVFFVRDLPVNGVYIGENRAIVKETARLRSVEGGIDEPLPRVTAHEIGHALGLLHRQATTNLMASGTTGTSLSDSEIARSRGNAARMR